MEKKRTTKGTKRTVFIYLLILAVLYVVIYIVPQVSDIFVETYSAEYNTLQVTDEKTCLFVRNEKVYTAPAGGTVNRVVKAGRLMRSGAHIVDVGNTACYSDMKGIISYYYDGLETTYTPDTMESLTSAALEKEEYPVTKASSSTVASGDVIYKVVDSQQWYLLCWLDQSEVGKYSEGSSVTVDFKDEKQGSDSTQIEMEVQKLVSQGEETMVILSCNRYYEDFAQYRIRECTLITSNTSGIFLETDSIVEEDGVKGVYVVDKLGEYNFTPIKILDQDGDITVVEKNYFYNAEGQTVETVNNYDEILRPGADKKASPEESDTSESSDGKKTEETKKEE